MIARLNLGGPARCVIHLTGNLKEHGFETLVAAGTTTVGEVDISDELLAAGGSLIQIPGLKRSIDPLEDILALWKLRALLGKFRPHVLHSHTSKAGFLARTAASWMKPRPILVHTFHGHVLDSYFGPLRSALFRRMERRLARKTDALIAVSPSVREELLNRHKIGRVSQYRVIPSGFPNLCLEGVVSLREELGLGDSVVAGIVGRMVPIKGQSVLLEALHSLLEEIPNFKLLVVGEGPLRSLVESYAARPPWKGALHLLGARKEMERIYKTLDLLVLPSRKEGLPTVLLEAVAAGVPIVASRIPAVTDLFRDGENILLFEPGSARGLCKALARLALDPDLRQSLAKRAADTVPGKVLDHAGVARAHAHLYRELMEKRANGPSHG